MMTAKIAEASNAGTTAGIAASAALVKSKVDHGAALLCSLACD
jgi:hypothetical protein